jgi:polysaccharide biosynthesis/export protein
MAAPAQGRRVCGRLKGARGLRHNGFRAGGLALACVLAACAPPLPPAPTAMPLGAEYQVGPGDSLNIFVWRNPELSANVAVRPDGRVSIPLVEDIMATGRTPTQLAREIEKRLAKYVNAPIVTIMLGHPVGPFDQQVRIIGEAVTPKALPYRENMTVLDAMIEVGGLTKYAAGNRATLVRTVENEQKSYNVRLQSLINDGDIQSNVTLEPGDVLIIPQTYF